VWMSGHPKDTVPNTGPGIELEPFLQKPVPAELLVATVADLLDRVRHPSRGSSPSG